MQYNFDQAPGRIGSVSYKWDSVAREFPTNPNVIPMWVADTDFPCPQEIVSAIRERAQHPIYGYSMIQPQAAQLVANWQKKRNGWDIDPAWVTYSGGVVPALNMAVVTFAKRGEGVIIQSPVYYPFKDAVLNNGRVLLENNLLYDGQRYVIDYEGLEQLAARPDAKLLILCNPHNPVGRVYTRDELEKIAAICLRHDVLIMADEIHSDLIYRGNKHIPIASLSEAVGNITLTAMAPSKTFNIAGLQISVIISRNPELLARFNNSEGFAFIPSLFGSVGLTAAYNNPGCADYVDQLMDYLWGNYQLLDAALRDFMPKLRCQKPEATYLLWLDCRDLGLNEEDLARFFVEEAGVGIEMGRVFGETGVGHVRMNIGCTRKTMQDCIDRLRRAYAARKF